MRPTAYPWSRCEPGPATATEQIGFYGLAGHSGTPRDLVGEVTEAERLGLGAVFLSERFNTKDAAVLSGAAGAVSDTIGVATGATNHNTRHPLVTATFATTMHRLTGGRLLGLGRGFDPLRRHGAAPSHDGADRGRGRDPAAAVGRRGGDGPRRPGRALRAPAAGPDLAEDIPVMLVALGERTLEFAGGLVDGVVLHTFFTDEALARSVAAAARRRKRAGTRPPCGCGRCWPPSATTSTRSCACASCRPAGHLPAGLRRPPCAPTAGTPTSWPGSGRPTS